MEIGEHLIWRNDEEWKLKKNWRTLISFNETFRSLESMESYESEQVVRGHHVYKSVWTPFIGEELICHQESGNRSDPFAVAVLKPAASDSSMVVGHVPRKISAACSVFLELGGIIHCTITGPRQYSTDLRQGGLDVPCKLKFTGVNPHLSNVARLVKRFEIPKKRKLPVDGEHSGNKE